MNRPANSSFISNHQLEEHFHRFCEFEYAESAEEALQIYAEWLQYGKRVCDQINGVGTLDRKR